MSNSENRRSRYLVPAVILLAVGAAVAVPSAGAFSAFTAESVNPLNSVTSGQASVSFVDPLTGVPISAASLTVVGALPEMSPKVGTFKLKNTGTSTIDVRLASRNLQSLITKNLDDVLVSTVKSAAGATLYSGKISNLANVNFGTLDAGEAKTFTIAVTWPSTANDNVYQGSTLTFDVVANGVAVAS